MSIYNKMAESAWGWIARNILCRLGRHDWNENHLGGTICRRCGKPKKRPLRWEEGP